MSRHTHPPTRGRHFSRYQAAGQAGQQISLQALTATGWLHQYIEKHGPSVKIATVEKYATLRGFTLAEIHRAAATLAIECYGEPGETAKYWRLR